MRRLPGYHLSGRAPERRRSLGAHLRAPAAGPTPAPVAGAVIPAAGRPREEEGGDMRDIVQVLAARARGLPQRRQVHALPPHQPLPLPRGLDRHAHRCCLQIDLTSA